MFFVFISKFFLLLLHEFFTLNIFAFHYNINISCVATNITLMCVHINYVFFFFIFLFNILDRIERRVSLDGNKKNNAEGKYIAIELPIATDLWWL